MGAEGQAPEPNKAVVEILKKRPLKSATSNVYAAQLSGYTLHGLDEYSNVDLDFINRYATPFLPAIVGEELAADVRSRLHELGIRAMSSEDVVKLKNIARTFDPDNFRPN